MSERRWFPNFSESVDPEVALAIRRLFDYVYDLREMMKKGGGRAGDVFVEEVTLTPEDTGELPESGERRRERRRRRRPRERPPTGGSTE